MKVEHHCMSKKLRKILNYHAWSDDIHAKILDDIYEHRPAVVNFFCAEEHEINGIWSGPSGRHDYIDKFVKQNIEVNFIFGAASQQFYDTRYHFPKEKIYTHLWPTYFLCFTLSSIYHNYSKFRHHFAGNQFQRAFISLNNRPHTHRCLFMDLLARNELLDKGAISWHGENKQYAWQWFCPQHKIILNDHFVKTGNSYPKPAEWDQSFLHLISECSIDRVYFSEKTWQPLLDCKPFLVQSCEGFYKIFVSMGFVLYDELFDYSFDSIKDDLHRTDAIMLNVKSIIGKDYNKLYQMLKPKILHNFNKAVEIARSPDLVIPIVKNSKYARIKYKAIKECHTLSNPDLDDFVRTVNNFMKE